MTTGSSTAMTPDEAGFVFVDPSAYADEARLHAALKVLREQSPIHRVEATEFFDPFWAVTRHADVFAMETRHDLFHNAPRPVIEDHRSKQRREEQGELLRTLIHMDEPDHRRYRGLASDWFLPANLKKLDARLDQLAEQSLQRMRDLGGECDFAQDIAMQYPLQVILAILGLPETDYGRMLKLTQELFGASDPELQRGEDLEALVAVVMDFFQYFTALTAEKRAHPTGDLASVLANATLDDRPLDDLELVSYYVIAATAGHDTTSSAMAGGLQALIEHPDQLARLQADPSLLGAAADEMIRWVTPVKHFMRTATQDTELHGQEIKAGDWLLMSYVSANRDEAAFADPFSFDVGRYPNKHLAFGFGVHYCLGAQLARMELKSLFGKLLPHLRSVELAGEPQLMQTLFVGGLKHLPIRYQLD